MSDLVKIVEFFPGESFFPMDGDSEPFVAHSNVSPNLTQFTLLQDVAIVEAGAGVPYSDRRIGYHFKVIFEGQGIDPTMTPIPDSTGLELISRGYASLDRDVTAALTVLVGERAYERHFRGPLNEDYEWRIHYPISQTVIQFEKLKLPIVFVLSVDNRENYRGAGLFSWDQLDGALQKPPSEDEAKEVRERLHRYKEAYREYRAKKA